MTNQSLKLKRRTTDDASSQIDEPQGARSNRELIQLTVVQPPKIKRLNVNLPETVFQELEVIAMNNGRTLTEEVRFALGLRAVADEAQRAGHKLMVTDRNGTPLKEVLFPK
jgi:hypothetical protein